MKTFRQRRAILAGVTLALAGLLTAAWWVARAMLRPVDLYSGATLLVLLAALALFNARKKLPFLPLGGASAWLQAHIYAGWLAVLVFGLHTGLRGPHGPLGLALWFVFGTVAASGVFGLWLSRWLPPRLAHSGESLIYEQIPRLRHQLEGEAARLVHLAETEAGSSTLADFHRQVLAPYFAHRPAWYHPLATDDGMHHRVDVELAALRRYLNDRETAIADQLAELAEAKRNLDFQFSGQRLLKLWLFAHLPLTYALVVLVGAHVWLVLQYTPRL
ncbi:MAG TPA: hypothetical protein VHD61_08470 [Lacunisphaera sp.]|nr:hypothetical protein [Lacunisphaera sp.]